MKGFRDLYKSGKKKNKISTSSKEQIINRAIQFHSEGNIKEAVKYYQKLISQGDGDHRVFSNYGAILQGIDKLQEAENSYHKAIELKPDFAMAHYNLGVILNDLGKLQEAENSYRKAIEINPNFANALSNLGKVLRDLGKLQDAEFSYRKAIALNPNFAMAHYNLGVILNDLGTLQDAELSTRKAIEIKPDFADAHSNLGNVLQNLGKLQDAELSTRKAIEINPDFADAYSNLGNVLRELGKLQDAEKSYRKAIELNPDFALAYYSLSVMKYSEENKNWQDKLFSKNFINNKLPNEQVYIYFARSNIFHKDKKYKDSSICLQLANNLKLNINPSNSDNIINKSRKLLIESNKKDIYKQEKRTSTENIFILGMPRSGSTLLESILSMRDDVYDLGEINILEEAFLEYKKSLKDINLADLYEEKASNKKKLNITTNKNLYNYQYAGIIASQIHNAKIIHCFRHPLDNILSIYRANFAKGNEYSSSLVDCAKVYLDQEEIMSKYKNKFRSKIYDLNYDSIVNNPNEEIKSLISWLGWKWEDSFLSPELNTRSVSTASSVQVRSPINSKSVGGWKNYKDMLKPAIDILTKNDKYKDINL